MKDLALGPSREVHTWPQYNVNGYKFHTVTYGSNKATMNSGVCIKGTSYAELESDYYGILTDVIELEYSNSTLKRTRVVLFKCNWFDPTVNRGWRVHNRYGLADINFKRKFTKYEPFLLASQAEQVYFAEYPVKRRDKADWRAICKIKARNVIELPDLAYQEDEMCNPVEPMINDELNCLRDGEEEHVIVDNDVVTDGIEESDVEFQTEDTEESEASGDDDDDTEEE